MSPKYSRILHPAAGRQNTSHINCTQPRGEVDCIPSVATSKNHNTGESKGCAKLDLDVEKLNDEDKRTNFHIVIFTMLQWWKEEPIDGGLNTQLCR